MRLRSSLLVGALWITTAAGLYASRGVLDRVLTPEGSARLGFLPPWQSFAGFLLFAALALLWLTRRRQGALGTSASRPPSAGTIALPLFAAAALIVPYLPWLPDRFPVLQMLAGPSKYFIWLLVLTQLLWVFWQGAPRPSALFDRLSLRSGVVIVGLATLVLTGTAAIKLTNTNLFPGGDEPHYLVIAQSLWRDGDLKIENNHERGDYFEYFGRSLAPHYLTRGADGEIYSIHPVGLPVLLAPIYGFGGYPLVVAFLLVMASTAAALMWRRVVELTSHAGAATFALAAIVLSPPFALNSFAVYPEIAAGLAVVIALIAMPRVTEDASGLGRWLIAGLAAGTLPWLSTKYAPMSAALIAVALSRIWLNGTRQQIIGSAGIRVARSSALLVPYLAMLVAWFAFFYAIWGTPMPQAPYGALVQTQLSNMIFGAPGLLFDQEYGLLMYAPAYILAATGLMTMWRTGGEPRRHAIELIVIWAALLGTVGAFRIWWGGSASPGRPIVSGLLLLALPMAVAFRAAGGGTARRAAQHLLLWCGAGLSVLLVLANDGLLINNHRDGTSSVLEYLSPLWEAWTLAPTFIHHETPIAAAHALAWLLIAGLAAWSLRRVRASTPARASFAALFTLFAALIAGALVMPRLPANPPWPRVDLAGRARLVGLDSFDKRALPNAVLYEPFRMMRAEDTESQLVLKVTPGLRTQPQPARVLHNGRFSLPAGRYRVDLRWASRRPLPATDAESMGLQIGRLGSPIRAWTLAPEPGGAWHTEIDLPLDAGFVGFVGSQTLERSIAEISITPLSLVDRSQRAQTPQVLAASQYGPTMVLFHDNAIYPEQTGFWTRAGGSARLAVANAEGDEGPTTLLVRPGPEPNRVEISAAGWRTTLDLTPGEVESVTLPLRSRRVLELQIVTERGFIPAQVDPASSDQRHLGAWIEVEPPPKPAAEGR